MMKMKVVVMMEEFEDGEQLPPELDTDESKD